MFPMKTLKAFVLVVSFWISVNMSDHYQLVVVYSGMANNCSCDWQKPINGDSVRQQPVCLPRSGG